MKKYIQSILEKQASRYLKKHDIKLVVVTGSVGKTSTKLAIAKVLEQRYRVRVHPGNHNVSLSVPPAIVGVDYPTNVRSAMEWIKTILLMQAKLRQPKDVDVVVQELGTDRPGDIAVFKKYLKPDIAVVTAVSPEHMENFKDMNEVAKEELLVASFSGLTIINRDDISEDFAPYAQTNNITTYGTNGVAEYHFLSEDSNPVDGFKGKFVSPEFGELNMQLKLVGEHNTRAAIAAGVVGIKMGLNAEQIANGMQAITPVSGRMKLLRGAKGSTLIDDTYNSSPLAAIAALQTLYKFQSPQRIAILGSMNELGAMSKQAHEEVAEACDPGLLAWVITVGDEAEEYLGPVAAKRGCPVKSFKSPYDAGAFVHKILEPGAVVLAKGSQNGVFAEEALKALLHSTADEEELVRQSPEWMAKKNEQFFS